MEEKIVIEKIIYCNSYFYRLFQKESRSTYICLTHRDYLYCCCKEFSFALKEKELKIYCKHILFCLLSRGLRQTSMITKHVDGNDFVELFKNG